MQNLFGGPWADVRELQTCPNSHLPARDAPKDRDKHVQIRAPTPSSVSFEQEQTYTNSHPDVENPAAEDLLAAGGANSGRFGARWRCQMFSESVLHQCNPRVHQCTLGLHRCKTLSEDICSGTPKQVLRPLLTTFRTFLAFDHFPRKAASQFLAQTFWALSRVWDSEPAGSGPIPKIRFSKLPGSGLKKI